MKLRFNDFVLLIKILLAQKKNFFSIHITKQFCWLKNFFYSPDKIMIVGLKNIFVDRVNFCKVGKNIYCALIISIVILKILTSSFFSQILCNFSTVPMKNREITFFTIFKFLILLFFNILYPLRRNSWQTYLDTLGQLMFFGYFKCIFKIMFHLQNVIHFMNLLYRFYEYYLFYEVVNLTMTFYCVQIM